MYIEENRMKFSSPSKFYTQRILIRRIEESENFNFFPDLVQSKELLSKQSIPISNLLILNLVEEFSHKFSPIRCPLWFALVSYHIRSAEITLHRYGRELGVSGHNGRAKRRGDCRQSHRD